MIAVPRDRQNCCECKKSLVCEHCGSFKWFAVHIIDNAVSPWYFCSKECRDKFWKRLEKEVKRVE